MSKLNADPDFVAQRAKREEEHQKRVAEFLRAEAPIVEELRAAGFAVESVGSLLNTATPYPKALPILLKHLQRPYPGNVREVIARALAVPEAKFAWDVLIRLFRDEREDERAKDGLAVAIAAIADDQTIAEVIALVRDPQHGPSRLLLLSALERSRDPRALSALKELETDPDLEKEIRVILRRLKRKR